MKRRSAASRFRRLLLAGPLLAGGLGLLGLFRSAVGASAATSSPTDGAVAEAESAGEPPQVLPQAVASPTPIFRPRSERVVPSAAPVTAAENVWFEIGRSVNDRPIQAVRLGTGNVRLALMGNIHGGWERNTERLVRAAYEHLDAHRDLIPPSLSVYVVPTTNPDGLAAGNGPDAAWNARGVDLNRNFDTPNWSTDTYGRPGGRYGPTGTRRGAGGFAPFSEPETRSIRDFILSQRIGAVISYHSGIVSVTTRDGGGGHGEPLAQEIAAVTGYPYIAIWTEYRLTGQFMDWLDGVGVQGVEVDLPNPQDIEWEKNWAAIARAMAVLAATAAG